MTNRNLALKKNLGFFAAVFIAVLFCSCKGGSERKSQYKSENQQTADDEKFCVLSFSPQEELPKEVKNPSIQIQFSAPVIPLGKLGKPSSKSEYVSITPSLEGVFRWYGTSLLSFESSESVIPQKEYTVTVNPETKSAAGEKLSGQNVFKFHTEELKLSSVIAGYGAVQENKFFPKDEVPTEYAGDVAVYFSNKINPKVIGKYLKFTDAATGSVLKYSIVDSKDNMLRVKITDTLADNMTVNAVLPAGAIADDGCYPVGRDQILTFNTLKTFTVSFTDTESASWGKYSNPVHIVFNHMIAPDSEKEIASHIQIQPEMDVSEANVEIRGASLTVYNLPVEFDSTYSFTMKAGIRDIYGRTTQEDFTLSVTVPAALSYARFKDSGFHMLEAQFAPKLVFEHQNLLPKSSYTVETLRGVSNFFRNPAPKTTVLDPTAIPRNRRIIEAVDIAPFLENTEEGPRGAVLFSANAVYCQRIRDWKSKKYTLKAFKTDNKQYIQVTDLGISVRYGFNKALVMVSKLSTGEPVPDAEVRPLFIAYDTGSKDIINGMRFASGTARTDKDGLAVIKFGSGEFSSSIKKKFFFVEVSTKNDRAIFRPRGNYVYNDTWDRGNPARGDKANMVTFMFTDRGLYKPGEKITFRGIDRVQKEGEYSPYEGKYKIEFADSKWKPAVYASIEGKTSKSGTFWGTWTIPETLPPGEYQIRYYRDGNNERRNCRFQVQFFERLRFEASASIPALTYYSGNKITADIKAQYLGGGSLSGTQFNANWIREPVGFSAKDKKYEDMRFGPLTGYDGRSWLDSTNGTLSADGKGSAEQKTGGEKLKGMAYLYRAEADITDTGGQQITASDSVTVHPARFYIGVSGIKGLVGFAKKGETLKFDYICLTPDENIPSSAVLPADKNRTLKVELLREDWKQIQQIGINGEINTRYEREMISEIETTESLKIGELPSEISVKPANGGSYMLRLSSVDRYGSEVITERRFYVTSSDMHWFNRDNSSEITMTPDKKMYTAGETAHILVQSALPKGRYLMTIEREKIISERVLELKESSTVIDIPVEEEYLPAIYVTLSSYSVRTGAPANDFSTPDLDKPKGFFGSAAIHIDPAPRKFNISITAGKTGYRPGEEAEILIHAEKDGKAVIGAEITLMAVDRGVIDLINYHVPDPVEYFYSERNFLNCIDGGDSRELLIDPVTYEIRNLFGGDSSGAASDKIEDRRNFDPTAFFVPELITDENGNAKAVFKLPDTITAYRITAVGVNANSFSLAESEMPVNNPISVREVLPRMLRVNDEGETGVVITNMTDSPQSVKIELNIYEGLEKTGIVQTDDEIVKLPGKAAVSGSMHQEITVPGNMTLPLMFMVKAEKAGWITVEYSVSSSLINERIYKPLEIEKPYVYETVTTVGELRSTETSDSVSVEERIVFPADTDDGSVTVQLDPTRLGVLKESVNYVFRYPYGCMEQRTAKILPLAAFGEYMNIFGLKNEVIFPKTIVRKEISSWGRIQCRDGGFPYWPDDTRSSLLVSIRTGEILAIAKEKGIDIPAEINVQKLASYIDTELAKLLNYYKDGSRLPYALSYGRYVMQRLGRDVPDSDIEYILTNKYSDINDFAFAGLTYLEKGRKQNAEAAAKKMKRYMSLTARGIDITSAQENPGAWNWLGGASENYALSLQLFTKLNSNDSYNSHIVYQLLQMLKSGNGYWTSTAATSRVLISLDAYIRANNLTGTDFTAEALIGGKKIAEGKFRGVDAQPVEKTENLDLLSSSLSARGTEQPVVIRKDGIGVLYYTVSMKYDIPAEEQYPRDEGICIYTEIYDAVTNEPAAEDTLVAGKLYRCEVHVSSVKDRQFVAVRVPVPAGVEIMNAAFSTTGTMPPAKDDSKEDEYGIFSWDYSLSHEEIYDCEIQYFWNMFLKGNQKAEFYFRPARKGTYNTPCAQAECMYEPEIFGRTGGNVWKIK